MRQVSRRRRPAPKPAEEPAGWAGGAGPTRPDRRGPIRRYPGRPQPGRCSRRGGGTGGPSAHGRAGGCPGSRPRSAPAGMAASLEDGAMVGVAPLCMAVAILVDGGGQLVAWVRRVSRTHGSSSGCSRLGPVPKALTCSARAAWCVGVSARHSRQMQHPSALPRGHQSNDRGPLAQPTYSSLRKGLDLLAKAEPIMYPGKPRNATVAMVIQPGRVAEAPGKPFFASAVRGRNSGT